MVHALGTNAALVRSAVFGIGCGLAGIGGVLAAPLVTASIGLAAQMIIDAFVIVIIGGSGRFSRVVSAAVSGGLFHGVGGFYRPPPPPPFRAHPPPSGAC